MITRIISFHYGNLNPEILKMQKAVFDGFKIPLEQIKTDLTHSKAIDHFLSTEQWDVLVLFDIDCIPLKSDVVENAISYVKNNKSILAAAQKASHIPNSQIYAAPCFMVLTKSIYTEIGKPSFIETKRGDVGEEISYGAREKNIHLQLWMPFQVDEPLWPLTDKIMFGYGTNYAGEIYHAFESNANHQSTSMFIKKCEEILQTNL